jgi:quercetin dioxygenase-like cupin family protein
VTFALRLTEARLGTGARLTLPAAPRVLYAREGAATVALGGTAQVVAPNTAWHGAGVVSLAADVPATVLRFELVHGGQPPASVVDTVQWRALLEHPIELDPARAWLMRCDRVDFAPGAVALPHGHKGGGIRCLLAGTLEVTVGEHASRLMRPGDAWFESGREPVLAKASPQAPTAFVRVSILPRDIRGQSSIVYVDPADAARGRPRHYTVYVDEPLGLP